MPEVTDADRARLMPQPPAAGSPFQKLRAELAVPSIADLPKPGSKARKDRLRLTSCAGDAAAAAASRFERKICSSAQNNNDFSSGLASQPTTDRRCSGESIRLTDVQRYRAPLSAGTFGPSDLGLRFDARHRAERSVSISSVHATVQCMNGSLRRPRRWRA